MEHGSDEFLGTCSIHFLFDYGDDFLHDTHSQGQEIVTTGSGFADKTGLVKEFVRY